MRAEVQGNNNGSVMFTACQAVSHWSMPSRIVRDGQCDRMTGGNFIVSGIHALSTLAFNYRFHCLGEEDLYITLVECYLNLAS
ncbi:hypothetical protein PoB_001222100 [Plakobranchus ocellatus]|uniref:Uncharacterized protein n=1 Tax=Plakobranchus ocellatus TaxID=259542 RepID=A0AAV3YEH2_9GAST|nr:hypothetical protein PoB_001222100 [Plakobranchus ocellatus]